MNHYTYMITLKEPTDARRMYIGVRSCKGTPASDWYFGSSRDLKKWIAENGVDKIDKQVLALWSTRQEAISHEMLLHDCFDVVRNKEFWNKAKQTTTGFDRTGAEQVPWNKGVKSSLESRLKQSIGIRASIAELKKLGLPHWSVGRKSPNKGKKMNEESKRKLSESRMGQRNSVSTEFKAGCHTGKKWFNNGEYENLYVPGQEPDGFMKGRKQTCQK